jgi:phosphinothricin acetyltransferase
MKPSIQLELASRDDVSRILELVNWAAEKTTANFALEPESLEQWLEAFDGTHRHHPWLVARDAEKVLGFAKSGPHRARGAFAWTVEVSIYIDPSAQSQGLGKALYGRLISLLREQGYVTLLAGITTGHTVSEKLHAAFGFVPCGTFHRCGFKFGAWQHVGYWELHLQPEEQLPVPVRAVLEAWNSAPRD